MIPFICGIPDIETREEKSEKGYDSVKAYCGYCGAGGANRIYTKGEYYYVEMDVEYKEGTHTPMSFGGTSGGGLWFVPIKQKSGQEPEAVDHILAGVVFYQADLVDNKRFLQSHGISSLYDKAYKAIADRCS